MNNVTVVREGSSIQLTMAGVAGTATVELTQKQATDIANALHVPAKAKKVRTFKSHPSVQHALSGGAGAAPGNYDDEVDG